MRRFPYLTLCVAGGLMFLLPETALARIKLITLPVRERVEIQLDHPSATLVEEERLVPLVKGLNQVDFSWANTAIDPETILLRVLAPAGDQPLEARVLSVSYPPNEAALVWEVAASASGSARVRISYVLGNLSKSFNYRAVASHDEQTLTLAQYMRLQNFANEEYAASGLYAGFGKQFLRPVGLNETKEMLVERVAAVPIRKTYTCDPAEFDYLDRPKNKLRVPMHYVLKNDAANQLGRAPLPYGKVRIFQDDGHGSTAFLGEDWGQFTPIDDELRLFLGVAQDIVVVRTIERNHKQRVAGNLEDIDVVIKYELENFKDQPAVLDVRENLRYIRNEVYRDTGRDVQWVLGPETTFAGGVDREKTTCEQVVFHAELPPRAAEGQAAKVVHKLHVTLKNEW